MKAIQCLIALLIALIPAVAAAEDKKSPRNRPDATKRSDRSKKPEPGKKPDAKQVRTKTDMIEEEAVAILKPYDKNSDFEIDVNEFEALAAEFKKYPFGPLKQFDKGKDGKVDPMIDRAGINVKLGSAAPPAGTQPAPATPKKPDAAPAPAAGEPANSPSGTNVKPAPEKSSNPPSPDNKPEANKK